MALISREAFSELPGVSEAGLHRSFVLIQNYSPRSNPISGIYSFSSALLLVPVSVKNQNSPLVPILLEHKNHPRPIDRHAHRTRILQERHVQYPVHVALQQLLLLL